MFNIFRLRLVFFTFLFLSSFILFDVFKLQTTSFGENNEIINNQNFDIFYIPAPRGEIYDRNGYKLVSTRIEPYLYINTRKVNKENISLYKQLIKYNFIDLSNLDINNIFLSKEILEPVISLQNIDYDVQQNLLTYDAFIVVDLPVRTYVEDSLFAQTIGYIGKPTLDEQNSFQNSKGNDRVGKNGLERYYESILGGTPGKLIFSGSEIIDVIPPIPGKNITITVDTELQRIVKESLIQGIDLANNNFDTNNIIQRGAVVVLNIETGDVHAIVSLPDFNPNTLVSGISEFEYKQLERAQAFNNFAIQGLYPPGSVFKVVAYWLAVNENLFPEGLESANSTIKCEGSLSFGFDDGSRQVYKDWKPDGHGSVNLSQAIKQSCNVYFWDIALKIWRDYGNTDGESILQEYSKQLGFSSLTQIDLPYEKVGIIPDRNLFEEWKISRPELVREEGWLGGDLMNLIIGQGAITSTPLQIANAYKTLLTGKNSSPKINLDAETKLINEIKIRDEFVTFLLRDLNTVTNEGGTAYKAFSILGEKSKDTGGKTGTAQNSGGKNNTSWFVGVDSISNTNFVIVTVIDEGGSGSAVAAPVTRRIIQYLKGYKLTPVEFGEITE